MKKTFTFVLLFSVLMGISKTSHNIKSSVNSQKIKTKKCLKINGINNILKPKWISPFKNNKEEKRAGIISIKKKHVRKK